MEEVEAVISRAALQREMVWIARMYQTLAVGFMISYVNLDQTPGLFTASHL